MSDCRIHRSRNKTANFNIVSNEVFQRTDMTMKAKGLYAYLMTLPDDWKIYKREIYKHFPEGRSAIDSAFKELEDEGYIRKERAKDEHNKFTGWDFIVYETADCRFSDNRETRQSENLQLLKTDSNKGLTEQKIISDAPAPVKTTHPLSAMKDPVANAYQQMMTTETPAEAWKSVPQERKQLDKLGILTQQLSRVTGTDALTLAMDVLTEYKTLRRNGRAEFWRAAPFTPSALVARWDQVIESMKKQHAQPMEILF